MRKAMIFWLFGFTFLISTAYADVTVKDFTDAKAKGGSDWAMVQLYVFGAGAAYSNANANLRVVKHQPTLYCQPDHLSMTSENYANIIEKEIARWDSPRQDVPIAVVLLSGLQFTFPCK